MKVLVIGGSGFLGRYIVSRLSARGDSVLVPTRKWERAKQLAVLPTVDVIESDVHNPAALTALMAGQDAVINLVGILKGGEGQPYGPGFARAHVELPRKIGAAARAAKLSAVLHVSALKASADAPSGYLRSKAAGEAALRGEFASAAIFRPSVIFGAGDSFLSLFAGLLRRAPLVPLACPEARFQPVWAGDVADAMVATLARAEHRAATYELCGPKVYSLRELVSYAGETAGCRRPIVGLSPGLSYLQAWAMEWLPGGPMTRDNVRSMSVASVCDGGCGLPFGMAPTPLEAVAPSYLGRVRG